MMKKTIAAGAIALTLAGAGFALAQQQTAQPSPAREGRGLDSLSTDVTSPLEDALVRGLGAEELSCAFRAATNGLIREIRCVDGALAARLEPTLLDLTRNGIEGQSAGTDGRRLEK